MPKNCCFGCAYDTICATISHKRRKGKERVTDSGIIGFVSLQEGNN